MKAARFDFIKSKRRSIEEREKKEKGYLKANETIQECAPTYTEIGLPAVIQSLQGRDHFVCILPTLVNSHTSVLEGVSADRCGGAIIVATRRMYS